MRVLFFREQKWWIAQGIEQDIAAQWLTIEEAAEDFAENCFATDALDEALRDSGDAVAPIEPAPSQYAEMWERATKRAVKWPEFVYPGQARPPKMRRAYVPGEARVLLLS